MWENGKLERDSLKETGKSLLRFCLSLGWTLLPPPPPPPHEGRGRSKSYLWGRENTFYSLWPAELEKLTDSSPENTRGGAHLEVSWEHPRCGPRSFGRFSHMESSFHFRPRELWKEHPEESCPQRQSRHRAACAFRDLPGQAKGQGCVSFSEISWNHDRWPGSSHSDETWPMLATWGPCP